MSTELIARNSAGRLRWFLGQSKIHFEADVKASKNQPGLAKIKMVKDLWGSVLEMDVSESLRAIDVHHHVLDLALEVERDVGRCKPGVKDDLLGGLRLTASRLSKISPESRVQDALDLWSDHGLSGFANLALSMGEECEEKVLERSELDSWLKEANSLIEEVTNSGLNAQARTVLVQSLRQFVDAILFYRINGTKGVADAAQSVVGGVYIADHQVPQPTDPQANQTVSRVWEFIVPVIQGTLSNLIAAAIVHAAVIPALPPFRGG